MSFSGLQEGTLTEPPCSHPELQERSHTLGVQRGTKGDRLSLGNATPQPFWDSTVGHKDSWLPPELRERDPQ